MSKRTESAPSAPMQPMAQREAFLTSQLMRSLVCFSFLGR